MMNNIVVARKLSALADEFLAESDYIHDPEHRHKPHDGQNWSKTPKGWSTFRKNSTKEFQLQYDEVVKKTQGTPIWMKAPNGRSSNLDEEQWIQAHTSNFKKWFGDWELASLYNNAKKTWDEMKHQFTFRFAPSEKLKNGFRSILGHDVTSLMITNSSVLHTKNHHGSNEEKRGQVNVTPEDFATIPYLLNNFDTIKLVEKQNDKLGNRAVEIAKRINGVAIIATIEKGKGNQAFVSFWKKRATPVPMSQNYLSPELNVQDDGGLHNNIKAIIEKIKSDAKNFSKPLDENGEPLASDIEKFQKLK